MLQGDVIALLDENYDVVVKYTYDTWGKVLSVTDANGTLITDTNHIGHRNPIRYRGYYYDIETGLYYLQSRYYDPEVGRFINCDAIAEIAASPMSVTDKNLFAYCDNNPVIRVDLNGDFWHVLVGAIIGSTINLATSIVDAYIDGDSSYTLNDLAQSAISTVIGGAEGALNAAFPAWSVLVSSTAAATDTFLCGLIEKKELKDSTGVLLAKTINSGGIAAISSGAGYDPMRYSSSVPEKMFTSPKIKDKFSDILIILKEGAKSIKDNVATWSMQYVTDDYLTKRGS